MAKKPTTTRRALFAAAPTIAPAATPAMALTSTPDPELIALGARWRDQFAKWAAAAERFDELEIAVDDVVKAPAVLYPGGGSEPIPDHAAGLPLRSNTVHYWPFQRERIAAELEANTKAFDACGMNGRSMRRCQEVLDALDAFEAERNRQKEALGLPAAFEACQEIGTALAATEDAILALRATTIEGLRVKATVAARYSDGPDEDGGTDRQFMWSVISDLVGVL